MGDLLDAPDLGTRREGGGLVEHRSRQVSVGALDGQLGRDLTGRPCPGRGHPWRWQRGRPLVQQPARRLQERESFDRHWSESRRGKRLDDDLLQPRSWEERLSRPVGRGDQAQVEPAGARRRADARDRGIEQCDDLVDIIGAVPVAVPRPAHEVSRACSAICSFCSESCTFAIWFKASAISVLSSVEVRVRAGGRVACGPRRFGVALRSRPRRECSPVGSSHRNQRRGESRR